MYNVIYSSLFQVLVPSNMLGRVTTGINTLITIVMPIGSLFEGFISNIVSYNYALICESTFK